MKFRLRVVQGKGAPQWIQIDADSAVEARALSEAQGLAVLSVEGRAAHQAAAPKNMVVLIEQLQSLLVAGLSIVEAIDTLERNPNNPWRATLLGIQAALRQGLPFSEALARQSQFPPLLVSLVKAAELTSDLPAALGRYIDHETRAKQVKDQIRSVALYPILLSIVGGGVILFLMLYVMPRFARIFDTMSNLPWSAQLMVSWARLLNQHGALLAALVASLCGLIMAMLANQSFRAKVGLQLVRVPAISSRLRVYYLARWYQTTAMLVAGGIPLPESVKLANTVLPPVMQSGGSRVVSLMQEGYSPASAFVGAQMTTPISEQLIRAGEKSGDVGEMLHRSAAFHEAEVIRTLGDAMRIIEPAVMTLVGLGVGVVVILMYLPIFELASAIQ